MISMLPAIPYTKLPLFSDVSALDIDVASLCSNHWVEHVNQAAYQGGWSVLPLRCQKAHLDQHPILQSFSIEAGSEWADLPELYSCPALKAVVNYFQCEVKAVRLMRLKPGAYIQPHRDRGLAMEFGEARFHVPIRACDQVEFVVGGQRVPMKAGELWYLNADMEHSVRHYGNEDRVNLVIDCKVNDWLKSLVLEAVKSFS